MSTIALIDSLRREGIGACAVCHEGGTGPERERLREAVEGQIKFLPLYWWNRKIRAARWKRPLLEVRQILKTGWARRSASRVAEFAHRQSADLVHTNTFLTPEGGIAARRLGLPHVWHLRELIGSGHPFQIAKTPRALARFLDEHASVIVANSQTSARAAAGLIPIELIRIVPNGIDLRAFEAARSPRSPASKLIVAMVGSLTSRTKKHALFVEAAARLIDNSNVRFRIYGHDPADGGNRSADHYSSEVHALVERFGLGDRFDFPGHLDPVGIMSEIDILVHPADNESFGRVIVEAMAAGLPVVGGRGGGVAEIVVDHQTGLLVEPDSPEEIASAIARLLGDPGLRERFAAAGRRRAEQLYSLASCTAGILKVYEEAMLRPLGGKPGAPLK